LPFLKKKKTLNLNIRLFRSCAYKIPKLQIGRHIHLANNPEESKQKPFLRLDQTVDQIRPYTGKLEYVMIIKSANQ